jgi:hypothetical protein
MNWIKNKLRQWLYNDENHKVKHSSILEPAVPRTLYGDPLRINVYSAEGGVVIETRKYNQIKDRENTHLYIVPDEQDLVDSLAKIITMETLRNI